MKISRVITSNKNGCLMICNLVDNCHHNPFTHNLKVWTMMVETMRGCDNPKENIENMLRMK